jgi:hypothetical protein
MQKFAWITFLTGLVLSGVAGFYSVVGLAMIFSGAYWPVIVLAGMLEVSKLVAVSWMYRYRHLAGYLLRTYFFAAILVLMCVTSMGIFGYLTRAHVESETGYTTAQLTLQEVQLRESQLQQERDQINTELKALTDQSNQLVAQLGAKERLTGSSGAVTVQRQTTARRAALLADLKRINGELTTVQKERITVETDTNKATADIGPLRYVAQAVYGTDDVATIRKSVVWLTGILMVVFDPMAIMLLIAANILFVRLASPTTPAPVEPAPIAPLVVDAPAVSEPVIVAAESNTTNPQASDVPSHLIRER